MKGANFAACATIVLSSGTTDMTVSSAPLNDAMDSASGNAWAQLSSAVQVDGKKNVLVHVSRLPLDRFPIPSHPLPRTRHGCRTRLSP